jgi:hypothetical protein
MPIRTTKFHTQRLVGRRYRPPRRSHLLTKPFLLDRGSANQLGKGRANELEMVDKEGRLFVERQIDERVERAITDQQHGYARAIAAAEQVRHDAIEQREDCERETRELEDHDEQELRPREQSLGDRRGPTRLGYGLLLLCTFLMLLPADIGAAQLLPLAPAMQLLLGVLLGAAMTWAAHGAAKKLDDLREAHRNRAEDAFGYAIERVQVIAAIAIPILVIIGTAIMRGQVFTAAERATGGLVQGDAANVAIAFVALLGFATAMMAGHAFHRVKPLREVRQLRAANLAQRKLFQHQVDDAQRVERQAEVTIAYLNERQQQMVDGLRHWGAERKARINQRAATVELKSRTKRIAQDSGAAEPGNGSAATPLKPQRAPRRLGMDTGADPADTTPRRTGTDN